MNCLKCVYYYVTWEPQNPKGCKFFGFKSKEMPSNVVLRNSGEVCQSYKEKIQEK
ncbi:MAG: hypothetical protein N4A40_04670 [Tissierellales bacterium]|nr:hypothetical protein [Tissierellales bacterium]